MRTTTTRSKLMLLFMAFALVLALPAMAFANDTFAIDGTDGFDTSNSKNSKFVLCNGAGSSVNVDANFNYSGGPKATHFKNGSTVSVTTSVEQAAQGFITANGGSTTLTGWDSNSDSATIQDMKLSVGDNWTAGTFKVTYTATGVDQSGGPLVLEDINNVQISAATTGCSTDGGGSNPPPVNTAPTVDVTGVEDRGTYEIGSVPAASCSVVDAEDADESATPQVSAISGPLSAYGLGTQTVTCSYTDGGGLSGSDTATYTIVDTGNPVISSLSANPANPNGSNGWYTSAVTATFQAEDFNGLGGAGAGFANTANPYTFTESSGTTEGSAVTINSGTVQDVAGNLSNNASSGPYKIDRSNPVVNITNSPANNTTINLCDGIPSPNYTQSDAISGVASHSGSFTSQPATASGVGAYTYSAQATDFAGRNGNASVSYNVAYGGSYSGVLQPINGGSTPELTDDNSRFKLGSTVPVKFRMTCGTTPIDNAVAKLNVKKADGIPNPGTDEAVSTAASTTGNLFRYDATSGQYIFNLSTKTGYTNPNGTTVSFAAGTYTLSVMLDDGSFRSVNINIVR